MYFIKKYKFVFLFLTILAVLSVIMIRPDVEPVDVSEVAVHDETPIFQPMEHPITESPKPTPQPEKNREETEAFAELEEIQETVPPSEMPPESTPAEVTETDSSIQEESEQKLICLLSVSCDSVFENLSDLKKGIIDILPADGKIYAEKSVSFLDGESVFDVLKREMEKENILLDYERNAVFDSIYIKGISGLYERDCGDLSGWIYEVNGKFPNKGCSELVLQNGDRVEFIYTCG